MLLIERLIGLLVAVVVLVRLARRLELPPAIPLFLGGLGLSFVPGFDGIELDPEMVFVLFLPPLLFYAAYFTSWRDFRQNARPIGLLAVGLVVMTTLLVGLVAYLTIPGLPLAAAFVLGAIVSPTDAIAATSITERIGVPRRIVTVLEGESLVNDASGIVAYRLAVAAVVTGSFSLAGAGLQFLLSSLGGIAVGLAAGWFFIFLLKQFDDAPVENTVTILAPFICYIAAERLHVSGVLAVVAAGLYFARHTPRITSSETRLQAQPFWRMLDFLFNGVLFLLVGLQLRRVMARGLDEHSWSDALMYALIISLAVIVVRFAWVYPATYVPRLLSRKLRERDPYPGWRNVFVVAWTGMRGAISLAAALSLPVATAAGAPFPERDLITFLAFTVILATLVVQGLSLPTIIRRLGLQDDKATAREEAEVRLQVARAAIERLNELAGGSDHKPTALRRLKQEYERNVAEAEAALEGGEAGCREYLTSDRQLRGEIINAERAAALALRDSGRAHDEAVRHVEHDLDLKEQQLQDHDHGLNGRERSR